MYNSTKFCRIFGGWTLLHELFSSIGFLFCFFVPMQYLHLQSLFFRGLSKLPFTYFQSVYDEKVFSYGRNPKIQFGVFSMDIISQSIQQINPLFVPNESSIYVTERYSLGIKPSSLSIIDFRFFHKCC